MGWGTGSWGTSAWGVGTALADLTITAARATSPRSVLVTLSREPLAASTIGSGDALNPLTWSLAPSATGGTPLVVLSVAMRSTVTFELLTLERFDAFPRTMVVASTTLRTASGVVISDPNSATFFGMALSNPAQPVRAERDLENPPFDIETHPGGTLFVDASGDYVNQQGVPFLRKLVYRRLVTVPGGFFHLPDYGLGIRLKEPVRIPDLNKLRAAIQLQLLREPEFSVVRVRLTLTPDGVLTIIVRAILSQTNEEVTLPVQVAPPGVDL